MPFKTDYCLSVGINSATYCSVTSAVKRILVLYRTARKGNLSTAQGSQLWASFFSPLAAQFSSLPNSQSSYDSFAIQHILQLAVLLQNNQRGDFGIAQKMYNLFMKDHWALNAFSSQIEGYLHLPLDRIILSKLKKIPSSWESWTRVVLTPTTQTEYVQIQGIFRAYWQHTGLFASPIEMEHFIWQRI